MTSDFAPRLAVLRGAAPRAGRASSTPGRSAQHARTATAPTSTPSAARWCARSATPAGCAMRSAARAFGGAADAIDTRAICLIRETLARHSGLADFAFAMQGLGSGAISLAGTPEQKAALPAARGARRGDRRLRAVRARRRLRRRRRWRCAARVDGDDVRARRREDLDLQRRHRRLLRRVRPHRRRRQGARGISAFIVDAGTPGFEIAERIDVIAPHPLARLRFDDCRVPAGAAHRRRGRGLQGRDAHARRLPHLGRRRRARLRAPRARRGAAARDHAPDVRPDAGRLPAHAGQARADGDHHRQRRAADLPRRLAARPGPQRHARKRRWPRWPPPKARSR